MAGETGGPPQRPGNDWIRIKKDGAILLQRKTTNHESGITTTIEKNPTTERTYREDLDPVNNLKRTIKEEGTISKKTLYALFDSQNGSEREILDDKLSSFVNIFYRTQNETIPRIELNLDRADGSLKFFSIDVRPQPQGDDEVLSLPPENRLEYFQAQKPKNNLEALARFYVLKGEAAVTGSSLAELGGKGEYPRDVLDTFADRIMMIRHPSWSSEDRFAIQTEFLETAQGISDVFAKNIFPSITEYNNFLKSMQQFALGHADLPDNFRELPEDEQRRVLIDAFNTAIIKSLNVNYSDIQDTMYHSIDITFGNQPKGHFGVSVYQEDEAYQEPQTWEFGKPYTFEGFEYVINRNGETTIEITDAKKSFNISLKSPTQIPNMPEVLKWIKDEQSEDWTKVPAAIPTSLAITMAA
jgi:hypothetical protein